MKKETIIAQIELADNIEYSAKGSIVRFINKEFKGNIDQLRKGSATVKDLTEVKDYSMAGNKSNDD